MFRKELLLVKTVERRHQFSPGQVPKTAEDHNAGRRRDLDLACSDRAKSRPYLDVLYSLCHVFTW
jgi:hypothetical protein